MDQGHLEITAVTASFDTIRKVYKAVRKHVTDAQMEKIIDDLLQVQGNQSFRETIKRLATLDATVEKRPPAPSVKRSPLSNGLIAAMQFGYKACEQGLNIQAAEIEFKNALK
jgi:hypothetical protein